ncbi:hypothetical protein [Falsiroseomonas ponticola]|jgi:hypothetical protein|uniref:hypothetical protein n=1 Tax=Falsiroseomonas ponticola TaxID=2786951 RepID=UPI0019335C40|nr:hypothetical protein [Roseomonas ponticola]
MRTLLVLAVAVAGWEGAGHAIAWWDPGGAELLLRALAVILLLGFCGRLADHSHEDQSPHG